MGAWRDIGHDEARAGSSGRGRPGISSEGTTARMAPESTDDLTLFLRRWRDGDDAARDALIPRVYDQLRDLARARLRAERPDHTLDTSGLVHEAYLRLANGAAPDWQDRSH